VIADNCEEEGAMFRGVKTLTRYSRRPKTTFFLRHPIKAVKVAKLRRDVKQVFQLRRVAMGLGATALAVPVGLWIGRRFSPPSMESVEAPVAAD
jgi:hypothetical protein